MSSSHHLLPNRAQICWKDFSECIIWIVRKRTYLKPSYLVAAKHVQLKVCAQWTQIWKPYWVFVYHWFASPTMTALEFTSSYEKYPSVIGEAFMNILQYIHATIGSGFNKNSRSTELIIRIHSVQVQGLRIVKQQKRHEFQSPQIRTSNWPTAIYLQRVNQATNTRFIWTQGKFRN